MQLLHSSIATASYCASAAFDYVWANGNEHKAKKMAYYNEIAQRSDLVERTLAALAQFFETAAARHATRRVYKTTLTELNELSNRELADLGMHRSELKRVAWESAYGSKGL